MYRQGNSLEQDFRGLNEVLQITRGLHYDSDATVAVPEPYTTNSFCILFPAKGIMSYRQIISSRLYIRLKITCSLTSRALINTGECTK